MLNNKKYNKKKQNKISSLIIEAIKYIQFYIGINYHKDKEIQKLNKIYSDFLVQKKDNIFLDYIYKQKLSIESFYYIDTIEKQSINLIENINIIVPDNPCKIWLHSAAFPKYIKLPHDKYILCIKRTIKR